MQFNSKMRKARSLILCPYLLSRGRIFLGELIDSYRLIEHAPGSAFQLVVRNRLRLRASVAFELLYAEMQDEVDSQTQNQIDRSTTSF